MPATPPETPVKTEASESILDSPTATKGKGKSAASKKRKADSTDDGTPKSKRASKKAATDKVGGNVPSLIDPKLTAYRE